MLPKINRLKKRADFSRVFREGRGFKEDFLFLKIVKNNLENSRFGFVVSKKFSNKAFLRNKIKRKLRELMRIKIKKIKKGLDGVIIISPGAEDFSEIEGEIDNIFKKAGLF